jgi:tellurite methyltransferase
MLSILQVRGMTSKALIFLNRCLSYAQEKGLQLKAEVADLVSFPIQENTYSLIILSNVLNFFNVNEISDLLDKAKKGLKDNGLIYINAFDPNDPSYEKYVKIGQKVTDFTFYRQKSDSYIHYFTVAELNHYFAGYKTITTSQAFFLDLGHGQPHYHGIIEMLLQKS